MRAVPVQHLRLAHPPAQPLAQGHSLLVIRRRLEAVQEQHLGAVDQRGALAREKGHVDHEVGHKREAQAGSLHDVAQPHAQAPAVVLMLHVPGVHPQQPKRCIREKHPLPLSTQPPPLDRRGLAPVRLAAATIAVVLHNYRRIGRWRLGSNCRAGSYRPAAGVVLEQLKRPASACAAEVEAEAYAERAGRGSVESATPRGVYFPVTRPGSSTIARLAPSTTCSLAWVSPVPTTCIAHSRNAGCRLLFRAQTPPVLSLSASVWPGWFPSPCWLESGTSRPSGQRTATQTIG
mmetsp:Transcript_45232/g.113197  ORF Transcript_45232/g.113197 Transcript_45232/m.113197 type:complete len:290 (-) Transcript_45232:104-973(-)